MGTTVSISSTFTAEPIQKSLEFWFRETELQAEIEFAPFNQLFQSLLDPHSQFATNRNGVNVALVRWHDLGDSDASVEENGNALIQAMTSAQQLVPLIVASCPCAPTFLAQASTAAIIAALDQRLSQTPEQFGHIHLIDPADLGRLYPVVDVHSELSDQLAHIPYTTEYFAALGTAVARKIDCLRRIPAKVIVVDLDNTIWGGVVGEDGPEGVRVDAPRIELQRFLLQQRSQGKLLAIASKNNEQDAWEAFRRPEMLLKQEHFAAWRINWQPKSSNLADVARELSLGLDSFIFIDDSPKEIAEVENNLPQVRTLLLPDADNEIADVLYHFWPFDQTKVTTEDRKRSESYQQEKVRWEVMREAKSLDDFVANLDLVVDIEDFRPEMLPRVSQLTLRTNQFNTTTIRRNESELKGLLDSNSLACITVAVKDRFGDYGNVGAVLYSVPPEALVVDSFLLSCRALGRGVEHQIVRHLGSLAARANAPEIWLRFQPTRKNQPALLFLDSLPATRQPMPEGGELFRITTEAAAQLVYRPVAYGAAIREDKSAPAPAQEAFAFNGYGHIARALRRPDEVCRRLETPSAEAVCSQAAAVAGGGVKDAPRTDVEKALAAIWAEVLHLPAVGIYDNFFDLGGDSFLAVGLMMRVIEKFNADHLTLSSVIDAPTVEAFSKLLYQKTSNFRCLVPIRSGGSLPNFFIVPGAGGNVLSLRAKAAALPEDQPFWCLQAPGLDGSATIDNVPEIAALYIREIRSIQPKGPYYLGGQCYGGQIALEMAQQLRQEGETIAILLIFDTYNIAFGKTLSRPVAFLNNLRFMMRRLLRHSARLATTPVREWPDQLRDGSQALGKHLAKLKQTLLSGARNESQPKVEGPRLARGQQKTKFVETLERVRDATTAAVEAYVPRPYPGKITLFRAKTRMVEPYDDYYLGWRPIAQEGVDCFVFEGDHDTFAHGPEFGPAFARLLAEAQLMYSGPAQPEALKQAVG